MFDYSGMVQRLEHSKNIILKATKENDREEKEKLEEKEDCESFKA